MSISQFSLGAASIAQTQDAATSTKPPKLRTTTALSDRKAVPEPR